MDVSKTNNALAYHNIFPENFELKLYKAFKSMKELGCDYFYFLGLDSGISYRFCTHDDWIDLYHDEQFILNDPLKRAVESSKFIALPWQQLTHLNYNERRSMNGRISFGIYNGLTVAKEFNKRKYIVTLATELKEHDLARYLMLEQIEKLEYFVYECMRLFNQYTALMSFTSNIVM